MNHHGYYGGPGPGGPGSGRGYLPPPRGRYLGQPDIQREVLGRPAHGDYPNPRGKV